MTTDAIQHTYAGSATPATSHGQQRHNSFTCRAQVELLGTDNLQEMKERLAAEIRVLQQVKHRNIITFHDWWFDPRSQCVNFITEYFTSGTLRQFRKRARHITEQALKRWAWQIVEGLVYLHGHQPPVIHRCAARHHAPFASCTLCVMHKAMRSCCLHISMCTSATRQMTTGHVLRPRRDN
jgi:hypothetical protein